MKKMLLLGSILFAVLLITLFLQQISDFAYELPYKWNHKSFVTLNSIDQDINEKLNDASPSGAFEMNSDGVVPEIAFSYSSWQDTKNKRYYYRFKNYGKEKFCAKSKVFPRLFGQMRIDLTPNQVKYFVVSDANPPVNNHRPATERYGIYDLLLQKNCFYFSARFGGSIELVVPQ